MSSPIHAHWCRKIQYYFTFQTLTNVRIHGAAVYWRRARIHQEATRAGATQVISEMDHFAVVSFRTAGTLNFKVHQRHATVSGIQVLDLLTGR
jgi:spore cortex formation protein SpoVR/YcgB (stage V sporulation)